MQADAPLDQKTEAQILRDGLEQIASDCDHVDKAHYNGVYHCPVCIAKEVLSESKAVAGKPEAQDGPADPGSSDVRSRNSLLAK